MYQVPDGITRSPTHFSWRGFGLRLWLLLAGVMAVLFEQQLPADEQGLAVILGFSILFSMQFALPVALYTYLVVVITPLLEKLDMVLAVKIIVQLAVASLYVWAWYTYRDRFTMIIAYTAPRVLLLGAITGIYTSYYVCKHHYRHR